VLQIDHKNGGGNKERNSMPGKSNAPLYRRVLTTKGVGYQLLCANCNWTKRVERREYIGSRKGVSVS